MLPMLNAGFEKVSILRKLEILYLRDNRFSDSIIASLSVLPSLKTLDLQANWLSRSFPAQGTHAYTSNNLSLTKFTLF